MMFIDTHCHLANPLLLPQLSHLLLEAKHAAVTRLVSVTTSSKDYLPTLNLAQEQAKMIFPAIGLHPFYVTQNWQQELSIQTELLNSWDNIIAVGEIGLDFYHQSLSTEDKAQQIDAFIAQLQLARKFDLPVILHNRRSVFKCIELLKQYPVKGGIAHAFAGSVQQAQQLTDLGFKLGLGTMLCRAHTPKLTALAQKLPQSAFVLETDAPDMAPISGTVNTPKNIILVAQTLAQIRHCSVAEIAQFSTENALAVLPL